MKDVANIGAELARQVFQLLGATAEGEAGFRRKLSHKRFLAFVQIRPASRVATEACATARHRARTSMAPGHDLRSLAPKFVNPFVKNQSASGRKPSTGRGRKYAGRVTWPSRRAWCRRGHGAGERIEMRRLPIFLPLFAAWRCFSSTGSMVCPGVSRPSMRKSPRSAKRSRFAARLQKMPEIGPIASMALAAFKPPMETFRQGRVLSARPGLDWGRGTHCHKDASDPVMPAEATARRNRSYPPMK